MNAFRLIVAVMAMATAAGPALGQDNSAQSAPPAETVGPRELENFSLEGRVTRPAEQAVQPATEPARPPAAQPRAEPATPREPVRDVAPAPRPARAQPADRAGELLSRPPTRPQPRAEVPSAASAVPPAQRPVLEVDAPPEQGSSLLMWIAALLVAGGAAAVYWFLRRGGERRAFAGGYRSSPVDVLEPAAGPEPLARAATTAPQAPAAKPAPATLRPRPDAPVSTAPPAASPPSAPVGIVASSLRPWIDVELTPDRALVDDKGAAIAFNVTLVNSGSAPARDVSIEACLLNAGARQDVELSDFYQRPKTSSDSIPVIAPMARVPLRTAVKIPREMIHEYEVEGRKLFMPMVAVSTRYRWSSGEGQTGASFLVGKGQDQQARLAPLRIDQGNRSWQGLGARRYEKGLRR